MYSNLFEVYDSTDPHWVIDRGLMFDAACEMLRYYHANRVDCSYGIRPMTHAAVADMIRQRADSIASREWR